MFNRVPADLVARLETRSEDRRKANPKFQKQDEMIKKFIERKARHTISLNEEKFRAEFVPDDDPEKKDEEKAKKEKAKKKYTGAPGLGARLLQRRGRPHRRRLPDPRLEGPRLRPGPRRRSIDTSHKTPVPPRRGGTGCLTGSWRSRRGSSRS